MINEKRLLESENFATSTSRPFRDLTTQTPMPDTSTSTCAVDRGPYDRLRVVTFFATSHLPFRSARLCLSLVAHNPNGNAGTQL